jgi:hypothetical protein
VRNLQGPTWRFDNYGTYRNAQTEHDAVMVGGTHFTAGPRRYVVAANGDR